MRVSDEPTSIIKVKDMSYKDDEVLKAWAGYFEELVSPSHCGYDFPLAQKTSKQSATTRSMNPLCSL